MTEPRDTADIVQLRSERFAAAQLEQTLRNELAGERARSAALERELRMLRSSESFRIGHRLVWAVERVPRRPKALVRWTKERLRGGIGKGFRAGDAHHAAASSAGLGNGSRAVLFVSWGASGEQLGQHVEQVWRVKQQLVDFEPVFLVDSDDLEPLRRTSWPVEYVIPLEEWRRHRAAHEWGPYIAQRLASVQAQRQALIVVLLGGGSVGGPLDQGVIHSFLDPGLATSDNNLLEPE